MRNITRISFKILDLLVIFMMTFGSAIPAVAAPAQDLETPTIQSDLPDYNPGQVVTLTGTGWTGDTTVNISVDDDLGQNWYYTDKATVQPDGTILDTFNLPTVFVAQYYVTATGAQTGRVAKASFTDANPSANIDQCANDPAPSPSADGCNSAANQWVNGNLGASKSVYFEGDSIPYRITFDNLSTSGTHTITIKWDTTKSGTHALDYLTTFNQSVLDANPCLGVSGCTFPGSPSTSPIPADPQVTGAGVTPIAGNFTLFGGTITNVSGYSYPDGTGFAGDKSATITITFSASVVNPVLAWGGHISTRANWGANNSAVAISGSPYHTALVALDGSGGAQDRSLSADAVIFPGSITVVKDATPNSSTSFGFTASPAPLANFSLVDDGTSANTKSFAGITTFTTYTVNENSIPAGWGFDSVSCSVTTPNGGTYTTSTTTVSINMKEGENWTCTYLDSQRTGSLTVIKHVLNDNGGTATADQWLIHVKSGSTEVTGSPQVGSESGTSYTLTAGTYNVSETGGVSGYTFDGFSGDCDSSGNVTVVVGQNKTCTLTNNDVTAHLKLVKTVTNDNGGTAVATDFTLSAAGPTPISGAGGTESDVNAGAYTLSETNLPGYTAGSWSCSGGTFDGTDKITLALGQSATCTIDNNDNSSHLKLVKTVTNDNGGTAVATDFTLSAAGPTPISGAGGTESDVNAGAYTLSETNLPGYTAGNWSCTGGTFTAPDQIAVALGQSATCTINNNDNAPALHLRKVVVDDNGGTATATDWTLSATGPTTLTGSTPVDSDGSFKAGTYALSEVGPAGYTHSDWSCVGGTQNGTDITVGLGESATCTITNDDITAHLKLVKTVTNDNGGTAVATDFILSASGPTPISGAGGAESDVNAGAYDLSETSVPGYAAGSWTCVGGTQNGASVTLALGQSATCTISNDDQSAHLKLLKTVTNDNGGTAKETDFTLSAAGPSPISGEGGAESDVNAGSYTLSETSLPGYTAGSWSCVGGTFTAPDKIALTNGQSATCTINNDDQQAYITVVKVVRNNHGGTAQPNDFKLTLDVNAVTSGIAVPVNPGTYTAGETPLPGYTFDGFSSDCDNSGSVTVALGESKTCTLTNSDIQPKLTLIKTVINDNGGTKTVVDFPLFVNTTSVTSGVANGFDAGTYTASETSQYGYAASAWGGDCAADGSVTLNIGDNKTCTITNNDIQPKLTLIKTVINDNGGTKQVSDFPLFVNTTSVTSGVANGFDAGSYTASETSQYGYAASAWGGDCAADGSVTLAVGDNKICTITNNDIQPKLTLVKTVINDNGGTKQVSDFPLFVNTTSVTSGVANGFNAGSYTASETSQYGYTASAWGGDCAANGSVTLSLGDNKTCTITNNDQPGTIVIIKNAKPAQGQFAFTTTGTGYNGFTLTGATTNNGNQNTQILNAGTYTVKEGTQLSWILTGIGGSTDPLTPYNCVVSGSGGSKGVGDLNTQTATIDLKNGDIVTCTFENTGNGATRTQGFWATHPELAQIAWFGGTAFGHTFPGVANTTGINDRLLCGRAIEGPGLNQPGDISKLMGGFWSDISKTSEGKKRSSLDQARMQLLQQLLAAELNASAFGSVPIKGTFADWEKAFCGTDVKAISNAQQQAASFNSNGDSSTFTPGTSANSKYARSIADIKFWDKPTGP